jgi:phenylalanyl-tRNA synthetase beta chain
MKISLNWLKTYVAIRKDVRQLADALTMVGLEVETVTERYAYLNSILVGVVTDVAPHPRADRLKCCQVDLGGRNLTIVCGAPNVSPGQRVPVALPGTVFPNGVELKEGLIRGIVSQGMICSQAELALGPDADGIMVLDGRAPLGQSLAAALNLSDALFEINVTPNRPDCLSFLGIAREVAAIEGTRVIYPSTTVEDQSAEIEQKTSVTIDAPRHCPRYVARMVEGVTVGPSPFWLQDRLMAVGQRPINNIVDITNFVLLEMGQPLHAFDYDLLEQGRIVVRTALEAERFTTLDGKDRSLTTDTLMICDGVKPVAVAGVMGGRNSEIGPATRCVLIESAWFDPVSIRRTAKRLGLATEASHRFERGTDPEGTVRAVNRAAALMAELGGGRVIGGIVDAYPRPARPCTLSLSMAATNGLLGTNLGILRAKELLETIGFNAGVKDADTLSVTVPTYRVDVSRPEDLMEEIARLNGFDRIPVTYPAVPPEAGDANPKQQVRARIRTTMVGMGFTEVINYSFVDSQACDKLRLGPEDPGRRWVSLLNPISADQAVMRTSMIPGLLHTVSRNAAHQVKTLSIFEIGRIYIGRGIDQIASETEMLAGLWTGARTAASWHGPETPCDFYDLKGAVERLLGELGVQSAAFTALDERRCRFTRPGQTAVILAGHDELGLVGQTHPDVNAAFDLRQNIFIFELNLDKLLPLCEAKRQAGPLPRFPAVARDITLIVDTHVEAGRIIDRITQIKEPLIKDALLIAVYSGPPIAAGRKSVSIRLTYRSDQKTLEDEAVNVIHQAIAARLVEAFQADLPA